ncbi:MAG: LutC/YkgG family protein [Pseudomonadales bacterium]
MSEKSPKRGREAILKRIKHSLRNAVSEEVSPQPKSVSASTADSLTLAKTFTLAAQAGGARVTEIANLNEASSIIVKLASTRPLSIAPQKELEALRWKSETLVQLEDDYKGKNCNGLVAAESAVAETGTVVVSTHGCPSGLLFLTERLFIVLRTADIKPDYESIWALRAEQKSAERPRTLHLISGPSRTADVEQTIQIGAHGPRQLDILLLAD